MTGRLAGAVLGRPVAIVAEGGSVTLQVSSLGQAWRLRKCWPALQPMLRAMRGLRLPLSVRIGHGPRLRIAPRPHPLLRFLWPAF